MNAVLADNQSSPLPKMLCLYDVCFEEFLKPGYNGQKHMQAILLREAFQNLSQQRVGVRQGAATNVLDVSCGPGEYSVKWTAQLAQFLPLGMRFFCADFPGGICKDTGEKYTDAAIRKIQESAKLGKLVLAAEPIGTEADLFADQTSLMPADERAHIIHWSHSAYHVHDSLGDRRNDARAIENALNIAVDKLWLALDKSGLVLSIHQTGDISDGMPSEMRTVARKYSEVIDDAPERIRKRVEKLGGYVSAVNFATPLYFPKMPESHWETLKDPANWETLSQDQERALKLLNFILYDFTSLERSGLAKLFLENKLSGFINDFRAPIEKNGGYILAKCTFQMLCKSKDIADKLDNTAAWLRQKMPQYNEEMKEAITSYL